MNNDLFVVICRKISTGAKIHSVVESLGLTMEDLAIHLDMVEGAEAMYEKALLRRSDFIVERLSDMIEMEVDIERAKLLQKHWMEVMKSQAAKKYGEKKSVEVTLGQHERDLEMLEKLEMAKAKVITQTILTPPTEELGVVHE